MKIVLIDDDQQDIELFCLAARRAQPECDCLGFTNVLEALSYINTHAADVAFIFVDAVMHPIAGKDCLIQLRGIPGIKSSQIIIYSGFISEKKRDEYVALGASRVLTKPIALLDLTYMLKRILHECPVSKIGRQAGQ